MARIFVSHANEDHNWVRDCLVGPLRAAGHDPFFSEESIHGGDDYIQRINEELVKSDKLVVVVSPQSAVSHWVKTEVEIWFRKRSGNNPIPVLMEPGEALDVHPRLVYCQAIDLSDPLQRRHHVAKLLDVLLAIPAAKRPERVSREAEGGLPTPHKSVPEGPDGIDFDGPHDGDGIDVGKPAEEDESRTQAEGPPASPEGAQRSGGPQPPPIPHAVGRGDNRLPQPRAGGEIDSKRSEAAGESLSGTWRAITRAVNWPGRPALKTINWTVLVLDAGNGRPMAGIPVRFRREGGTSAAGQLKSWLGTQRGTSGPDGKVTFTADRGDLMVEVSIEDIARYRQMPPKPGLQPPPGIHSVILVAKKS